MSRGGPTAHDWRTQEVRFACGIPPRFKIPHQQPCPYRQRDSSMLSNGVRTASVWPWESIHNITIYDATAGAPTQVLRVLEGHATFVNAISWHPFLPRLASGSWDGTVRLWDPSSGEELGVLHASTSRIHTVTWSSDGLRLACTTSETDPIRIWDASIADRFLKSHGDLRAKALALAGAASCRRRSTCWSNCASFTPTKKIYRHGYCTFAGRSQDKPQWAVRSTRLSPCSNN